MYILLYLIENILQLELRKRRAFHVFDRTKLLCHPLTILFPDRLHFLLGQLIPHLRVISQIRLCADYEAWYAWAVVMDFWKPLLPYVLKGCWRCDGEADKEDVGLWV